MACHTDLERVGWFSCSNELVNRLHENVVWGIRSNFVGVPTDCPQRDERLGWTGDIQIIAPTASFLYNCTGMLTSWLEDLQAEQDSHGLVPLVVPDVLGYCAPMAAWGDAAVIVPMTLFERTGDVDILRRQFNSMSAWVDGLVTFRGDRLIWDDGWQLGDWLDPSAPSDNAAAGKTDRTLVAAAYFVRSAALVSKAAKILGMHEQALRYGDVASRVRHAFQREFVTPVGRVASDSQTAYAMAIAFDLLEPDQCIMAGQRLADLVRDAHSHIGTGFIGAPLLCDSALHDGTHRICVWDPPPDNVSVLPLSGHHGRHDDVGALGCPPSRRKRQPRKDDLVQPLRVRSDRRLATQDCGRIGAWESGVSANRCPPATWWTFEQRLGHA